MFFIAGLFIICLAGDVWLLYYFDFYILSKLGEKNFFKILFAGVGIAFGATMITGLVGCCLNGCTIDGFISCCKASLIIALIVSIVLFAYNIYYKLKSTTFNYFTFFLFNITLFDITVSILTKIVKQGNLIMLLKVFGVITFASSILFVITYPWLFDINNKVMRLINKSKNLINSTSEIINGYKENYEYADKTIEFFAMIDGSDESDSLLLAENLQKRKDYNNLCKIIKKQWTKKVIKKIFNNRFIESESVVGLISLLRDCDNNNTTNKFTHCYEKYIKSMEASWLPQLPKKITKGKQLDTADIYIFNNSILNEIHNKNRDIALLKADDTFESVVERYLHLKSKVIVANFVLIIISIVGLAYNILL